MLLPGSGYNAILPAASNPAGTSPPAAPTAPTRHTFAVPLPPLTATMPEPQAPTLSARALARLELPQAPMIWLLDEPFDSLDDEGIQALHGLLSPQARRGGSVLMTSHQAITLSDPLPEVQDLDFFAVAA